MWPLLNTDTRAPNCTIIPSRNALRFAVAELLKTAALPNTYVARNTLKKAEAGAMANLENLELRTPCIVLPSAPRPPAELSQYEQKNSQVGVSYMRMPKI